MSPIRPASSSRGGGFRSSTVILGFSLFVLATLFSFQARFASERALKYKVNELSLDLKRVKSQNEFNEENSRVSARQVDALTLELAATKRLLEAGNLEHMNEKKAYAMPDVDGVAVVCCLDGPGWLQNRYTFSITNTLAGLPPNWKVQLFHKGSAQSIKGLTRSPGLQRLMQTGRVVVTELEGEWAKRSRSEVYLSKHFWKSTLAEKVLIFGHGSVICHNSQFTINNFTSYDLCAAGNGDMLLVKKNLVLNWLNSELAPDQDFLPNIHGPILYLVGKLKKIQGLRFPDQSVVSDYVLNSQTEIDLEAIPPKLPFAISGTMSNFSPETRKLAIEKCPEIKMIFPSLDNPACFGASNTLDKDSCVNSLCVSNPKTGGC